GGGRGRERDQQCVAAEGGRDQRLASGVADREIERPRAARAEQGESAQNEGQAFAVHWVREAAEPRVRNIKSRERLDRGSSGMGARPLTPVTNRWGRSGARLASSKDSRTP